MAAILLVDDSPTVRADLAAALDRAGFATLECQTLAEARIALRSHPVALAILDRCLPDGDGVELLAQIREDFVLSELPVLMLSNEAEAEAEAEAEVEAEAEAENNGRRRPLRRGADGFIGKPYDPDRVIAQVRALIGAPPVPERVLIVDGSAAFCAELAGALGDAGYTTTVAATGSEGLRLAATSRPAAIVVDGAIPDMDATSLVRRLRLDPGLRTTPCLLLTTSSARDTEIRALEAGADGVIRRDDLGLIVARVRAVLRSTAAPRGDADRVLALKRLLVVDDDQEYRSLLAVRLGKRGYDVEQAGSGEDALELLGAQGFDCILLDRSMAGIGGIETCRRVKGSGAVRDTPLIFLTASEQREAVLEGLGAGADDFVSKASGFDVVSARIQAQIRRKQIEDEQRAMRDQLLRSELDAAEARAAKALAETRAAMAEELGRTNAELAQANRELEAFSYSVSHDLRAPLRTVSAFTHAIMEDLGERLDDRARDHIRRVLAATARMSDLIDSLLELARINRAPIGRHRVDLSRLATTVLEDLSHADPVRPIVLDVTPGLIVHADARLMRILLDHLIGNAWKFTVGVDRPQIDVGHERQSGEVVYFVRDNGSGFDMSEVERLFTPFQRLHADGAGIGLATARRIIERHGGKLWAEGVLGSGAKISFTLPATGAIEFPQG